MISLRLSKETETRLALLAEKTGHTKTFYVKEALERYLEDLEDAYLTDKSYGDLLSGKDTLISHDEFWKSLDD